MWSLLSFNLFNIFTWKFLGNWTQSWRAATNSSLCRQFWFQNTTYQLMPLLCCWDNWVESVRAVGFMEQPNWVTVSYPFHLKTIFGYLVAWKGMKFLFWHGSHSFLGTPRLSQPIPTQYRALRVAFWTWSENQRSAF